MQETKPIISVITPVLNAEKYIQSCIMNVLAQGLVDKVEHIIYDGGSSDKTLGIIKGHILQYPHIRLISVAGTNQSKAMNEAIKLAKGSIIAILNVDDFYSPGVFNDVLSEFKTLAQGSFVVGNLRILKENDELKRISKPDNLNFDDIVNEKAEFPWNPSAYFYHRSLHDLIGYYDESDDYAMDLDFVLRVLQTAHVVYRDLDWGNYRQIPGTKTYENDLTGESMMIKKKVFDRYRRVASRDVPGGSPLK